MLLKVHAFLLTFVYAMAYAIHAPLVVFDGTQLIEAQSFGVQAKETYLSSLLAAYLLSKTVSAPLIGYWSDRLDRGTCLMVTLAGTGVSLLVHAFSDSIEMLVAARFLMGMFAANGTLVCSHFADHAQGAELQQLLSIHDTAWAVSRVVAAFCIGYFNVKTFDNLGRFEIYVSGFLFMCLAVLYVRVSFGFIAKYCPRLPKRKLSVHSRSAGSFWGSCLAVLGAALPIGLAVTSALAPIADEALLIRHSNKYKANGAATLSMLHSVEGLVSVGLLFLPIHRVSPNLTAALSSIALFGVIAAYPLFRESGIGWLIAIHATKSFLWKVREPAFTRLLLQSLPRAVAGSANGCRHGLKGVTGVCANYLTGWSTLQHVDLPFYWRGIMIGMEGFGVLLLTKLNLIGEAREDYLEGKHRDSTKKQE